jgi:hypothetical protein
MERNGVGADEQVLSAGFVQRGKQISEVAVQPSAPHGTPELPVELAIVGVPEDAGHAGAAFCAAIHDPHFTLCGLYG